VIFAVLIGNQLHGIVGMFIAVPLIPLVRETWVFFRPRVRLEGWTSAVLGLAPDDALYEKIASNLREAKARDGVVIALVNPGDADVATFADAVLTMPKIHPALQPIVSAVPLQLLAYHVARRRGCDIDQPRNLAKSVTVE